VCFQSRSLAPPTETPFHPIIKELNKEKQEEKKEEKEAQENEGSAPIQLNLLTTVLRKQIHRAEEQRDNVRRRRRRDGE